MYNKELREVIREYYENAIFLGADEASDCYDNSIVGLTEDGVVVYDYDSIINELMTDNEDMDETDAIEWYDYNIARAIPYAGEYHPIVIESAVRFYDDAKWIKQQKESKND